jgi:hypothetical protein
MANMHWKMIGSRQETVIVSENIEEQEHSVYFGCPFS